MNHITDMDWFYWLLMVLSFMVLLIATIAIAEWKPAEKKGSKKPHHIFIQDD